MTNSKNLSSPARGSEQKIWMDNMLHECGCPSVSRMLRGRAKQYAKRYQQSFRALCGRMEAAGYTITRTPGVRGGEWGAIYRAMHP